MSLADRLLVVSYFSYRKKTFRLNGVQVEKFSGLIDLVLERYARRFGKVEYELAKALQERLAIQYSNNATLTMRALDRSSPSLSGSWFEYPLEAAREARLRSMLFRYGLEKEYEQPAGKFCTYPRFSKYDGFGCEVCGNHCSYYVIYPGKTPRKVLHRHNTDSGWLVCGDKRCRLIAFTFKRSKPLRDANLAKIILKAIKHDGNNETWRRLAKHFVRHSGRSAE